MQWDSVKIVEQVNANLVLSGMVGTSNSERVNEHGLI